MVDELQYFRDLANTSMQERWLSLWNRIGAKGDPMQVYDEIVRHYSEPHRKHHNLGHIEHCLNEYYGIRPLLKNPDEFEFALWHHDEIYEIGKTDNEMRSAALSAKRAMNAGLPDNFGKGPFDLIMASKDHKPDPYESDKNYFLCMDLLILGQPEDIYWKYEDGIIAEYLTVYSKEEVRAGRKSFLEGFIKRDPIFPIESYKKKYDGPAKENMRKAIQRLQQ